MTNDVILALNEIGSIRPQGRYAYLNFVGVRPSEQRRGIGHGLMRTGLARSDALALGVHLETTNSTNFGFYRVARLRGRNGHDPAFKRAASLGDVATRDA